MSVVALPRVEFNGHVYSYPLPACHSRGHQTSPCRCSSRYPCHTSAGTAETLHTNSDIAFSIIIWHILNVELINLFYHKEYLLWDGICSWHIKWHWIWTHLFPACSPQQRTGTIKEKGNVYKPTCQHLRTTKLQNRIIITNEYKAHFTWASCLAREMSTVSRSSRLPYKRTYKNTLNELWM